MATDREKRILAARLLEHFTAKRHPPDTWIETADNPLDATVLTAPLDILTEEILQHCNQYDWDTVQNEVQNHLDDDVAPQASDLNRVEAATADYFIHQVHRELRLLLEEVQEDPMITPALPDEYDFDSVVYELTDEENDTTHL